MQCDVTDGILLDGLAELSSKQIEGLHLGLEEIIRGNINDDRRTLNPHVSLHLKDNTIGEIFDALCASDTRYTWSTDGLSINLNPSGEGPAYLLNLWLERISLNQAILIRRSRHFLGCSPTNRSDILGRGWATISVLSLGLLLLDKSQSDRSLTGSLSTWVREPHGVGPAAPTRECSLLYEILSKRSPVGDCDPWVKSHPEPKQATIEIQQSTIPSPGLRVSVVK